MIKEQKENGPVPVVSRNSAIVREHEILRVSAGITGADAVTVADQARMEILAWAQNRCGGRLPPEAWSLENFDYLSGGRNSVGVRINNAGSDIWAIRADDPDKSIAGRTWTTEVVVGLQQGDMPRFSARLLVSTAESEIAIEPHTPGFVQQVAERFGLVRGGYDLDYKPWFVESLQDAERLIEMLDDPERNLPIFVLTAPDDANISQEPLLNPDPLSRALLGIGHVVVVPAEWTWALTNRFGKVRSVFGGAARAYLSGFDQDSNPYDHRLFLADQLSNVEAQNRCSRWMRQIAATESIRHNKLGTEVLSFANIRNASLRVRQEQLTARGASESEQLAAAEARIKALEKDILDERAAQEYFDSETKKAEERAEAAEAQHRASVYRIRQLQDQLEARGDEPNAGIAYLDSWIELSNWCDVNLAGHIALAPAARRGIRAPEFEDLNLVVRCLLWLANDYRNWRIRGGEGSFRDFPVEGGVWNSPCGSDEFDFDWQGRQQTADWHIKSGGNTRDPKRCLRIYYCWEPETQQVIVAHMPTHRDSAIS